MVTGIDEKIRKKIVRILQQRDIKQKELAGMIGVMPQNLNAYMTGKRGFGKKNVLRIAQALDIPAEKFYTGNVISKAKIKRAKDIPLLSWQKLVDCEHVVDVFRTDYADGRISYDSENETVFAVKVEGNSMSPEFKDGNIVIVSPLEKPSTGDFVIVRYAGNTLFRKIKFYDDTIVLKAVNVEYDDIAISSDDKHALSVLGKIEAKLVLYQ
ncbi:MAG: XRE family transcriptional regulator [Nitrospirae bacterium YQR-1]